MSPLEIFITYLAIGSAFAMRAYFLNRRRHVLTKFRAVVGQFLFWLPIFLFRLVSRSDKVSRAKRFASLADDPEFESRIEGLLSCFPSRHMRNQAREVLERYAALHTALEDQGSRASGQFEIYAIAGNGNGSTGTPCLYRKNLSKLRYHKLRTTEDLIGLALKDVGSSPTELVALELTAFFEAFGDRSALEKLKVLDIDERAGDPAAVRMAA